MLTQNFGGQQRVLICVIFEKGFFGVLSRKSILTTVCYRVLSRDVTAAILVSQNNETAAMLVSQTSPLGVELFSYANAFFCYNKFAYMPAT